MYNRGALWKAGGNRDKVWFIILFLVNTVGILEIFYIFIFSKKSTNKKQMEEQNSPNPEGGASPKSSKPPRQYNFNYTVYLILALAALLLAISVWSWWWWLGVLVLIGAGVLAYLGYMDYKKRG